MKGDPFNMVNNAFYGIPRNISKLDFPFNGDFHWPVRFLQM